jgi:hypothetical protein
MSYFVLTSPVQPGSILADFEPYDDFTGTFRSGAIIKDAPPKPIELTWNKENEEGQRVHYYSAAPVVLMTLTLIDALNQSGADNLDTYPVVIRSMSGHKDCLDYAAVNVIGAIAAADMDASEYDDENEFFDGMYTVDFDSIVIDEKKAQGALLFSLAESISTVVIHETVANFLIKHSEDFGLTLPRTEDHYT